MYKHLGSTDIVMYDFLGTVSFIALLIYNLLHIKQKSTIMSKSSDAIINHNKRKKKIKLLQSTVFFATIETVLISCVQYLLPYNRPFGDLVGTGANYFGLLYFSPLILSLFCLIISVDPKKQIDLITPAFPLALCISKIACFCHGCCNGIECTNGLYNYDTGLTEFPVQLVESGIALVIFIVILLIKNKLNDGTVYPVYVILYSATRFFSEFLRSEEPVFLFIKKYQILCIIGVIVGIAELIVVKKCSSQINKLYKKRADLIKINKSIL